MNRFNILGNLLFHRKGERLLNESALFRRNIGNTEKCILARYQPNQSHPLKIVLRKRLLNRLPSIRAAVSLAIAAGVQQCPVK